jgi:hypothetical protein
MIANRNKVHKKKSTASADPPFLFSRLLFLNMEAQTVPHTSGSEKTPRRNKFFKHHWPDGYSSWKIVHAID